MLELDDTNHYPHPEQNTTDELKYLKVSVGSRTTLHLPATITNKRKVVKRNTSKTSNRGWMHRTTVLRLVSYIPTH